jgi:hypothetical protein
MAKAGIEMTKPFLILFITILLLNANTAMAFQEKGENLSEESDSTEAGFILRSQDLFWQTGYHPVTLDRMSFMLDSHIYGRYGPVPDFYADGIPFDPSFFGMTFTQLVPIPIHQMKQSQRNSRRGSGIIGGKPYDSGIIELWSEPLKKGLSVSATGQIGHNGGEPGPWVFDPERVTPNVERFGPWMDGMAALRLGNWFVKGVLRRHSYVHVDEFLQNRVINLRILPETGELLGTEAETTLGLVETGIKSETLDVRLQALTSESEEFLFFQPVAREVPTIMESRQLSGVLNIKLSEKIEVQSLAQIREKTLGYRLHRFSHNFDLERKLLLVRASVNYSSDKTTAELGSEFEETSTEAPGLTSYSQEYIKGFARFEQSILKWLLFEGEGRVTAGEEDASLSGSAGLFVNIAESWQIGIRGQYNELLPEQARPLDEWVINGYNIFSQLGIDGLYLSEGKKSRSRELSVIQRAKIGEGFTIDSEIGWIENLRLRIPFQYAAYNFPYGTKPGTYLLQDNEGGRRLTGRLRAQYQSSPRLSQSAGVYLNRVEDGNRLYNLYWGSTPDISVQYSVNFKPFPDLEMELKTQYVSEREWPEFERIDGRSNRSFYVQYPYRFFSYENEFPAHLNIDLTVSKWFWEQRLRGVFLIKNLLNSHYQTHPLGIREGFGYLLRLEVRL